MYPQRSELIFKNYHFIPLKTFFLNAAPGEEKIAFNLSVLEDSLLRSPGPPSLSIEFSLLLLSNESSWELPAETYPLSPPSSNTG